jgi:putative transposase
MARPLRVVFEGACYHLMGRGNRREQVFFDEDDCRVFLSLLAQSLRRYEVTLQAYVLMGNHFHLLARPNKQT